LHAAPHAPQFALSVCVSTHENPPFVVHALASGAHKETQLPFEHTLAGSHALPHAPQFCGSVSVLVHAPLHETCPPMQPVVLPFEQATPRATTPAATTSAASA
jgi:hypothetical protein